MSQADSRAGIFRFKLGALEVVNILDGALERPPHPTFGADQAAETVAELAKANNVSSTAYDHVYVNTVVDTGRERVLFDTGNGKGRDPNVGKLPERLMQAGYKPEQIDLLSSRIAIPTTSTGSSPVTSPPIPMRVTSSDRWSSTSGRKAKTCARHARSRARGS